MTNNQIRQIAEQYRAAIEEACRGDNRIGSDLGFYRFPHGSCGDTCYILAQHLSVHYGIRTLWVSTERGEASHAYLVVKDDRVRNPEPQKIEMPDEIKEVFKNYSGGYDYSSSAFFKAEDIANGLIIDITADQFPDFDEEVYVGYMNPFYRSFDFISAVENDGLNDKRLCELYHIVERYCGITRL